MDERDNMFAERNTFVPQLAYSYSEIYILYAWTASKHCIFILLQIFFWMSEDNNKIDIVQYKLGVAYISFRYLSFYASFAHSLTNEQTYERMKIWRVSMIWCAPSALCVTVK